ncbi:MAG: LysE family transporter [Burkholderiaceae bacterium]|nr:LysE family transporter [Burkholderiaceae bacterium]
MSFETWLAFFAASWLISLSPGAGAVYAMSCGLNHGFARGYVGTIGLIAGILTSLVAVTIGLGALLSASSTAFEVVKWCGVAYLLWVGVQQWRQGPARLETPSVPRRHSARALIARGWALNAVNPKGILFMLAVVPQFVDPARPLLAQYAAIGATLVLTDVVVMAAYTALAARVLASLRSAGHRKLMNRAFGALFVGAAALLAGFKRAA